MFLCNLSGMRGYRAKQNKPEEEALRYFTHLSCYKEIEKDYK